MASAITIDFADVIGNVDALLKQLPVAIREKALMQGVRAALKPVQQRAKQLCPKGGPRVGKKAGKKHLRDTIAIATRNYGAVKVGIVGPAYPAGAHGHLVEYGHEEIAWGRRTGRQVPPHPFLRPAVEQTAAEQKSAFEGVISKHLAEATK